jgi:hypothetical protein
VKKINFQNTSLKNEISNEKRVNEILNKQNESSQIELDKDKELFPNSKSYEQFYDIVVKIDSLKQLNDGWEVKFTEDGLNRYEKNKNETTVSVGVVGNYNKGKTNILQKLCADDEELPQGYSIQTQGISVKYPSNLKKSVTLIDTAGYETALKLGSIHEDIPGNEKQKEDKIIELARDKHLTELFLQTFVLEKSNIIIAVVGQITYSDQKLLNRLKSYNKGNNMLVIHNLLNFVRIEQVENYIKDTFSEIMKLKKINYVQYENYPKGMYNQNYYVEIIKDNKDTKKALQITHLIMAKDYSEAGNYYNPTTIHYMKDEIKTCKIIKEFDILDEIKKHLYETSPKIMEEESKIHEVSKIINEDNKLIKIHNNGNPILLKKCLSDELGVSRFFNSRSIFTPNHVYYKDHLENEFIIKADIPDLDNYFVHQVINSGAKKIIKIDGQKNIELEESNENFTIYDNIREKGKFSLQIEILTEQVDIDYLTKKEDYEEGVLKITYNIRQANNAIQNTRTIKRKKENLS